MHLFVGWEPGALPKPTAGAYSFSDSLAGSGMGSPGKVRGRKD